MTLTSTLVSLFLSLMTAEQTLPSQDATQGKPESGPTYSESQLKTETVNVVPLCAITRSSAGQQVKAYVTAETANFEGRAHLQLSGKRFFHEDLRPVKIKAGARLQLPVPSVPMPNELKGELTLLNSSGDVVCAARL